MMLANGSRDTGFGGAYCSSPARVIGFLDRGCTPPMRVDLYGYADCLSEVVAGWNLDRLSALFDLLEAHGCVEVPLRLGAAEPDALPDDDLWTALYLSGFLTTDMTEEPVSGDRRRALRLPNNELRHALRLVIIEWFVVRLPRTFETSMRFATGCAVGTKMR